MGGGAHALVAFFIGQNIQDGTGVVVFSRGRYIAVHAGRYSCSCAGAFPEKGGRSLTGGLNLHQGIGIVQRREKEELSPGIEPFKHWTISEAAHYHLLRKSLLRNHLRQLVLVLALAGKEHP